MSMSYGCTDKEKKKRKTKIEAGRIYWLATTRGKTLLDAGDDKKEERRGKRKRRRRKISP